MKLQYCGGTSQFTGEYIWFDVPAEKTEDYLNGVIGDRKLLLEALSAGKLARYKLPGTAHDWFDKLRDADAVIEPKIQKKPELVRCSCGHSVSKINVMNASLGSSCPDCYDRMSD